LVRKHSPEFPRSSVQSWNPAVVVAAVVVVVVAFHLPHFVAL
jgi:hypothetical protein